MDKNNDKIDEILPFEENNADIPSEDTENNLASQNIDTTAEEVLDIEVSDEAEEILMEAGSHEDKTTSHRWVREILEWSETIVVAVVFVVMLFTFVTRTSQVFGVSMLPTLHDGDVLMVSRMTTDYKYGDIVVVTKPNYFDEPIIKRIIATEGQTVNIDFDRNVVYVDGKALEENYINEPTQVSYDVQFPVEVPKGMVFVMGDNRNYSLDSRSSEIGMVDERYILGKAYLRVLPFGDFGGLYGK